jgi:hypothetical protein
METVAANAFEHVAVQNPLNANESCTIAYRNDRIRFHKPKIRASLCHLLIAFPDEMTWPFQQLLLSRRFLS